MANQIKKGNPIRVNAGVVAPDVPDISIENWTGLIVEVSGKKGARKCMIEWDDATLQSMPAEYMDKCEELRLYYKMACLNEDEISPI